MSKPIYEIYLRIKEYNGYDDFYTPIDTSDKTWGSIMDRIESVLDDKWLDNDGKLEGLSLEIDFVTELPEGIDWND